MPQSTTLRTAQITLTIAPTTSITARITSTIVQITLMPPMECMTTKATVWPMRSQPLLA